MMTHRKEARLTAADARRLFTYDPATGALRWSEAARPLSRIGRAAGKPDSKGYSTVYVGGSRYLEHRVIWLLTHGAWPEGDIDHANGIRGDNRLCNLRACSRAENQQNRPLNRNSTSGHAGVYWNKQKRKWQAKIQAGGRAHYLGRFSTAEDAAAAYAEAKRRLHTFAPEVRVGVR